MPHWIIRGLDRGDGSKQRIEIEADTEDQARSKVEDCMVIHSAKRDHAKERTISQDQGRRDIDEHRLAAAIREAEERQKPRELQQEPMPPNQAVVSGLCGMMGWGLIAIGGIGYIGVLVDGPSTVTLGAGGLALAGMLLLVIGTLSKVAAELEVIRRLAQRQATAPPAKTPGSSVDPDK